MVRLPDKNEREHDPVRAEAFGKATAEQIKELHDDPEGWLAELRLSITGIQSRLLVIGLEAREKSGALKVKAHLEARMPYVKQLVLDKKHRDSVLLNQAIARGDSDDVGTLRGVVSKLTDAIAFHHAMATRPEATEDEIMAADEELWKTVGITYTANEETDET